MAKKKKPVGCDLVDGKPVADVLAETLDTIDEYVQMGVNSGKSKHWEAALWDILALCRDVRAKMEMQKLTIEQAGRA